LSGPVPQWVKDMDASIKRVATRIIDTPRDKREQAFEIVRRNFANTIRDNGFDPASPPASTWLDTYMEGLRLLVRDIEASGGGISGHT
jgi:hypothetical protein